MTSHATEPDGAPASIPVIILTGFLGSGKTTLLNRLLKLPAFSGTAVIINEFGETALDHHLVETASDEVVELANGCLCCTVRGQLAETLERLVNRETLPRAIIIETTGLADPQPVIQAILSAPRQPVGLSLHGLVALLDPSAGGEWLSRYREARDQIRFADLVLLSRLDLAGDGQEAKRLAEAAGTLIADTGSTAPVMDTADFLELAACHGPAFLVPGAVNPPNRPEPATQADFRADDPRVAPQHGLVHDHAHHHHHVVNRHDDRISCLTLQESRPMRLQDLEMFLDLLASAHGDQIPRLKGLAAIRGVEWPLLVQMAGRRLSPPEYLPQWPSTLTEKDRITRITVFVDGIDPQFVRDLFGGFTGNLAIDRPDRQALADNPLAVAGAVIRPHR